MTESTFRPLALGQFVTLRAPQKPTADIPVTPDQQQQYHFQNFFIAKNVSFTDPVNDTTSNHSFVPFGFSGITVDRQGNNVDAELIFGNNSLARSFADRAISQRWMATVYVVELRDLDNPDDNRLMYRYIGQVTSGAWKDTQIGLRINSVLDAVGGDVPARTLHQKLVGALPMQGNASLR